MKTNNPRLSWSAIRFIEAPSAFYLKASILLIIFSLFTAIIASYFIEIDVSFRATGSIADVQGTKTVVHQQSGKLNHLYIVEDSLVKRGDTIAWLEIPGTNGNRIRQVYSLLKAMPNVLANRKRLQQTPLGLLGPIQDNNLKQIMSELAKSYENALFTKVVMPKSNQAESASLKAKVAIIDRQINSIESSNVEDFLKLQKAQLIDERWQIQRQILAQDNQLEFEQQRALREFNSLLSSAKSALTTFVQQYHIKSPVSGQVARLQYKEGDFIEAGKPIVILLPKNSNLIAEINIDSSQISKLSQGSKVIMDISAYPSYKFGYFTGTIIGFDQAIDPMAAQQGLAVFKARVSIDQQRQARLPASISNYNTEVKLLPGMNLTAEVVTKRDSLFSLGIDKIFGKE